MSCTGVPRCECRKRDLEPQPRPQDQEREPTEAEMRAAVEELRRRQRLAPRWELAQYELTERGRAFLREEDAR
jgi:hypothetical protein